MTPFGNAPAPVDPWLLEGNVAGLWPPWALQEATVPRRIHELLRGGAARERSRAAPSGQAFAADGRRDTSRSETVSPSSW